MINDLRDKHYVVFDGTSCFVVPGSEVRIGMKVLGKFTDIDDAFNFCDEQNEEIGGIII